MAEIKLFSSVIGSPDDPPTLPIQNLNILSIFCVRCAISNGTGGIDSPILLVQRASVRQYYTGAGYIGVRQYIGAPMSPSANRQC